MNERLKSQVRDHGCNLFLQVKPPEGFAEWFYRHLGYFMRHWM